MDRPLTLYNKHAYEYVITCNKPTEIESGREIRNDIF